MDAHIEQILKKLIDLDTMASQIELGVTQELKKIQEEWQKEIKGFDDKFDKSQIKGKILYEDIIKQAEEDKKMIIEITGKKLEEMEKEYKKIKPEVIEEVLNRIFSVKGRSYE